MDSPKAEEKHHLLQYPPNPSGFWMNLGQASWPLKAQRGEWLVTIARPVPHARHAESRLTAPL